MLTFRCTRINKQTNHGASAFLFDLRNSTKITRFISYDRRLLDHIIYMRNLHTFIYSTIYGQFSTGNDKDEFAINDTGDGYICVFWSKNHSLDCMKIAIVIKNYLSETLFEHNKKLKLRGEFYKLAFGFAIHTGGLTVERVKFNDRGGRLIRKDFILGILPNSVSRLETLNKLYTEYNFVASGNYKNCFVKHADNIGNSALKSLLNKKTGLVQKSLGRINVNDSKLEGHHIYTFKENFFKEFSKIYM